MRPQEALAAVVRAIQTSPFFDPGDIITDEFDPEGRNNRLETPFVVVLPVGTVRDQTVNTDRDVVDDIRDFDVGTGQRADDLSGPGVRRWRHESSMRYVSRVASTDGIQPFETIVTPTDPDLKPTDADSIDFEYEITT